MTPTIVSENIIEVAQLECEGKTFSRSRIVTTWSNGARYLHKIHFLIGSEGMKLIGGQRTELLERPAPFGA